MECSKFWDYWRMYSAVIILAVFYVLCSTITFNEIDALHVKSSKLSFVT